MIEKEITTHEEANNLLEKIVYQIASLRDFEDELEDKEILLKRYEQVKKYSQNIFQIDTKKYDDIMKNLENKKYDILN